MTVTDNSGPKMVSSYPSRQPLVCADCGSDGTDKPEMHPYWGPRPLRNYHLQKHPLSKWVPCATTAAILRGAQNLGYWQPITLCQVCKRRYDNRRHHAQRTDKTCDTCGQTFTPSRSDARYCSHACRQHAHRQRQQTPTEPST